MSILYYILHRKLVCILLRILHRQFQFSLRTRHFQNLSLLSQSEETKFDSVWLFLNEELMHECFPNYLRMGTARIKDTDTVKKKLSVNQRLQIDFSAAFDGVNHQGILNRLCSVGIGGSVLSILTQFLSNRSQHVMVDGCRSKLVDLFSGVPQGSVLSPLLFLLCTSYLLSILENSGKFFPFWLIGYADNSALIAVVCLIAVPSHPH